MFRIKEFINKENRFSDWVPWVALIAPGVLLNKDGSLQKTFRYRGKDLDSATEEEMLIAVSQLNNVLRRLSGQWAMYIEARREFSNGYSERKFPDIISAMIDAERRDYFSSGQHYESCYYFTLQYLPPQDKYDKFEQAFINKEEVIIEQEIDRAKEHIKTFKTEIDRIFFLFNEVMSECEQLNNDETLSYIHSCVSNKKHCMKTPAIPVFLDCMLCDTPLIGGLEPALGDSHYKEYLGVVSVLSFPPMTFPGILDELNRLNFEYRWVTRYIPMDKPESNSFISKLRRDWWQKRKTMFTSLKEAVSKSESAMVETDAIEKYNDAQGALAELEGDYVNFGYFKTTIIVKNSNKKILNDTVRNIEKTINSKGFTTKYEDMNALGAYLGTLPGMANPDVRWPVVSSMNLAHMFPISSVWAGDKWNKHLNAPPLMQAQTSGSTPFRFNLHVGDVANAFIVGPIGSGKSVLLNTIIAQYRGYDNSQTYIFDKGGSCRVLTAGVGGDFYDLGDGNQLAFQPLLHIDDEKERMWGQEWLEMIYVQEKVKLTPKEKKSIWEALNSLARVPADQRTLSGYYMTVQGDELKRGIERFIRPIKGISEGGPYGSLFDNDKDNLTYGRWQAFEMGEIMDKKGAVMPTLQYLFHVIEKRCTGIPTLIDLDECWVFLDNPLFAEKIREWFKTMRKNNVAIIFATQNLTDIVKSSIAPAILESCFTRIFLPNANAINPSDEEVYRMFNINEKERRIIAMATPKRQYYYKSEKGSRLFELALSSFALSYIGSASKEDQYKCKEILANFPRNKFNKEWLNYKGEIEAIKFIERFEK